VGSQKKKDLNRGNGESTFLINKTFPFLPKELVPSVKNSFAGAKGNDLRKHSVKKGMPSNKSWGQEATSPPVPITPLTEPDEVVQNSGDSGPR